ncbi:MAG: putative lipid II flippase FtsW [Acidimicrobiales bacterium]
MTVVVDLDRKATAPPKVRSAATMVRHRNTYLGLVLVVVLLNFFGLVMIMSASSVQALRDSDGATSWLYVQRQSVWMGLSVVVLLIAQRVPYRVWGQLAPIMLGANMLLLVAATFFGTEAFGAQRWLVIGPLRLQPGEFLKFTLLAFVAAMLARRERQIGDYRRSLNTVIVMMIPVVVLLLMQPDFGSTLIIGAIIFGALFVAGVPLLPTAVLGAVAIALGTLASLTANYRLARITSFLDPAGDPDGAGFQISQSRISLEAGKLWGSGIGQGHAKWGYLPNAHTDFIFAVIGEELGLIGAGVTIALFMTLGLLGYVTALRAPDLLGTILAAGITVGFMFQAFVNIGGVVGILPITGLTLPFISSGGSSLLVTMLSAGVLLNVARHAR